MIEGDMAKSDQAATTRLSMTVDLDAHGRHVGDVMIKWSDNSIPLGYHPVPIISLRGAPGPTLLIFGGTHGDEFEGPTAIMRIAERFDPSDLNGQLILVPGLNAPAFMASARVSPLDGQNLNRAFPGDPNGGPTAMLAHFVETVLIPRADAVIDLHSGGKASVFEPCTLPARTDSADLTRANLSLAKAFGLPLIWVLGAHNDNRSVNAAAARVGVPMIAAELGGGGNIDPDITDQTEAGIIRCMEYLGLLPSQPVSSPMAHLVEVKSPLDSVYAPTQGLFDRRFSKGQMVSAGDLAGYMRFPQEPDRPAEKLTFPQRGYVLAHGNRGLVQRGDLLALVAQTLNEDI